MGGAFRIPLQATDHLVRPHDAPGVANGMGVPNRIDDLDRVAHVRFAPLVQPSGLNSSQNKDGQLQAGQGEIMPRAIHSAISQMPFHSRKGDIIPLGGFMGYLG